jgi:mannosyl-oligosaccharide glucosidase
LSAALYAEEFEHLTGMTAYLGVRVPDGEVWRIKGVLSHLVLRLRKTATKGADYVMRSINAVAQKLMTGGVYTPESPPDPFALFQLQNEAYADANVYAFQKAFAGSGITRGSKWGFDVFHEPIEGSEKGMTREC